MSVRATIQIGDKRLKAENEKIANIESGSVSQLISDLVDTMYHYDLIGIAAPQIGENYQLFITEPRETETRPADQSDELRIYINPEIIAKSEEQIIIYEGCGCIPNQSIFGPVSRPKWVTVKALNERGEIFEFTTDGILGRVIQHEYDHLQGIEFIQKVTDNSKILGIEHYREQIKSANWHKENCKITKKEFKKITI
ncbi:peptide deformylase [Candidatus Dojkabacteria bacterium]|uniref:Peptide deformylase n=1 Tax=Candidatus Dojkabacteria bacterium TaxID=2099670 RepID=A0A955L8Z7_9BACT|nr:peptide deformylase [Candidatus Dojkabacteria bacterium]